MTHPLRSLWLVLCFAAQAVAQDSTASIAGQIRGAKEQPLADAFIVALGTPLQAKADSQGRFQIRGLPVGSVHLRVVAYGFEHADTTLSVRSGQRGTWNVLLHEQEWIARYRREEAARQAAAEKQELARAAAGGLDSIRAGLVHTDTAAAFNYERFGIDLLSSAIKRTGTDSSRVLSPLSAGQALALALAAAKDSTAIAIVQALHLGNLGPDGVAARSERFNDAIRLRRDVTLKVANALWVDTSATLEPKFATWARVHYGALVSVQPLRLPQVVAVVNRWADSATDGAIPVIRKSEFGESVEVALMNAVYFKGKWLEPFDSSLTTLRPFATAIGERVETPTMERTTGFAYRRGKGFQALRVPYMAGLTAMYIVLPDSGVSAVAVLEALENAGWPLPDPRVESRAVQLRLPRLHVAQATDLRSPFTALGLGIVFDSSRADFGGLVVPRPNLPPPCLPLSAGTRLDPCTRYRISEADQHVYLDLDEQGTTAAAVTSFGFGIVVTSVPPPPMQFYVDRPFLFALRDEKTGTFLFVGYIAGPRQ